MRSPVAQTLLPLYRTLQFAALDTKVGIDAYNFTHFRTIHLLRDGQRTLTDRGIQPGDLAPNFTLPRVGGGVLCLSDLPAG